MNTRREIVKAGAGLAAIIVAGKAPAALVRSMGGMRGAMMGKHGEFNKTWDFRVAYFQSTAASGFGYFVLPAAADTNPAILESDLSLYEFFFNLSYSKKMTFGFAPGTTMLTRDKKFFGCVTSWMGMNLYNSKWRPSGFPEGWIYQPTGNEFPVATGTSAEFDLHSVSGFDASSSTYQLGYTARDSAGRSFSYVGVANAKPAAPGDVDYYRFNATRKLGVFGFIPYDNQQNAIKIDEMLSGVRFFQASAEYVHPRIGLKVQYIPVVKSGQLYVAEAYTGALYPNIGGNNITHGPQVADDWDPLAWEEA